MHDMWHGDLHSIGEKLAYTDTQLKVLNYAMKQNSDILWYPIKNVDTQITKKRCVFTQWPQILIWSYVNTAWFPLKILHFVVGLARNDKNTWRWLKKQFNNKNNLHINCWCSKSGISLCKTYDICCFINSRFTDWCIRVDSARILYWNGREIC